MTTTKDNSSFSILPSLFLKCRAFTMLLTSGFSVGAFLGTWLCAATLGTTPVFASPLTEESSKIAAKVDDLLRRMSFLDKLAQTRNLGGILGTNATYDKTTVDGFNNGLGAGSICTFCMTFILVTC